MNLDLEALARYGQHHRFWYRQQAGLLKQAGVDPAVFAITSPRVSVMGNWRLARQYHEWLRHDGRRREQRFIGMMGSTIAALKHWEATGEIRGPKTGMFHAALCGEENALVLDVWMARVLGVPHAKVTTSPVILQAYVLFTNLADHLGWTIVQTQAAVWTGIRRVRWFDSTSSTLL